MKETDSHLMNADEVAQKLSVCRSTAYRIIRELNAQMEREGRKTIPGRVSSELLEKMYLTTKRS